jgi:outer membrane receptor protein involved in Fe transport
VGFEVAVERDIRDVELKGELGLWRDFYSASSAAWDPYFVQTGLSARYQIAEQLDVLGGFRFHLIRGSDTRSVGRLYPRMAVSWYATKWLTAFAKFEPYVQRNSLSSLVESSPYVAPDARILHPEYFTNFSIGAEADASTSVRTKLTLNYRQARNYPVFVDPSTIRVWSPEYGGTVRIVSVDADLYADIADRDNVGASVSVRSTRYSTTDKSIPYFPALLISSLFQHRFPFGLMLGTTMQVIGSQHADTQEQRSLAAFALWDINAEYVIAPRWNVKGTLQNLLDQNQMWWEGYAGPPRTVSLGMSYTW